MNDPTPRPPVRPSRLRHYGTIIIATVGVLLVLIFSIRAFRDFQRFRRGPPPMRTSDVTLIRDWMTIGYLARMYGIPPEEIARAMNIDHGTDPRKSISQLAQETGQDSATMITALQEAIQQRQSQAPPRTNP